ncbi:SAC3/GANP family protein [Gregarina niphandrodes]|uniref:SAC3/GANP family protein n=1 Tax=Gregarina niphandrodes TaxID=110365 RepID=A0A023B638_GRENI|nr:SAC3/GANP family protein [Gregarina niphandrodes]EZG62961.1 SAC3/GANP family protein [Gregarina niphandrodes]|eukprot:XP_011130699.1 SAC3/GANP family protein [Gregarina niphandrodes]
MPERRTAHNRGGKTANRSAMNRAVEPKATAKNGAASKMAFVNRRFDPVECQKRMERAGRFESLECQSTGTLGWQEKLALLSSTQKVQGRSTALEKQYLRLCGAPDPALIRSPEVLKVALVHIFTEFFGRVRRDGDMASYRYIEEQLRAIRQDYVVQGIRDHQLLYVYYVNSIVSLVFGDLGQFNQCQCQMAILERELDTPMLDNEFHRTLYAVINNLDWTKHRQLLGESSSASTNVKKCSEFVDAVKACCDERNYAKLFRLVTNQNTLCSAPREESELREERLHELYALKKAMSSLFTFEQMSDCFAGLYSNMPFLARALVRTCLPSWRIRYLCMISKSQYVCALPDVRKWLRDSSDESCLQFLRSQGAVFVNGNDQLIDCTKSLHNFLNSPLLGSKNKAMG